MLVLVVLTLTELLTMIFINDLSFANVIQMGIYIILLPLGLVFGIIGLLKGVTTGALVRNVIFILVPAILFVLALPHFTYQQGQVLAINKSKQQITQFSIATSRTVPVTQGYSWLLYHREYYYQARLQNSGQSIYFTVNPVTGRVFSSSHDYWNSR